MNDGRNGLSYAFGSLCPALALHVIQRSMRMSFLGLFFGAFQAGRSSGFALAMAADSRLREIGAKSQPET